MPLGSVHEEAGLVLEGDRGPVLRRDDGGSWRLDGPHALGRLTGRRVRLRGRRTGFDTLEVVAVDGRPLREPRRARSGVLAVLAISLLLAGLAVGRAG